MPKAQLLYGILNIYLHCTVRHVSTHQTSRSRAGNEHVSLHASSLEFPTHWSWSGWCRIPLAAAQVVPQVVPTPLMTAAGLD